ncbi:hypothetical protein [Streptomyces sp. Z26]|uniref:hypothetical protein n=1 Tax=Streptomyces sp. Z26 TaxID=2500177 RepID=UPI000EF16704|nr:hypothetical protein [Streptomyces sp. Z26]RLL68156.1 hypothetical protein D7M15_16375 [Streptomyces sp. Z26]
MDQQNRTPLRAETITPEPARLDDPLRRALDGAAEITVRDVWGSVWSRPTPQDAAADLADTPEGSTVEEWHTTTPAGRPLTVVRTTHPQYGPDIWVIVGGAA